MRGSVVCVLALLLASASMASAPARRVVSLNPSLSAILLALDAEALLVGVDDFSARQHSALAALPRVGGFYNPSLERVVALEPDLVVLVPSLEQRDFRAQLAAFGVPVLALDPVSFEEVLASIEQLGARVGRVAQARARVEAVRSMRARVLKLLAAKPRQTALLVLQRDPLFVAGGGTFVDDLLDSVGVENLARELPGHWPRVSREWLIAAAPEWLIDSSDDPQAATHYWSRWPSLPAVATARVRALPPGVVTLPGPWLDRALVQLVALLHGPDLAAELERAPPVRPAAQRGETQRAAPPAAPDGRATGSSSGSGSGRSTGWAGCVASGSRSGRSTGWAGCIAPRSLAP